MTWTGQCISLALLAVLALNPGTIHAEQRSPLSVIREGHWLEVRGVYTGEGRFEASRVEIIQDERYQWLVGTASDAGSKDRFELMGRSIEIVDKTDFEKIDPQQIDGKKVKVEGYYLGGSRFTAREVSPRGEGRERLAGRADRVRPSGDGLEISLMNFTVTVPGDVQVRHDEPVERYALSEARTQPVGADSRNEDDLFGKGVRLTENLLFAGLMQGRWTGEQNFDLDDQRDRDRQDWEGSARIRLIYRPSNTFIGVAELRYSGMERDDDSDGRYYDDDIGLGETFAYWIDPFSVNLDVQAGRIDFDEQREWLYDQNLDGVRLFHFNRFFVTELSVSTTLNNGSPRDESATNTILYVSNGDDDRHFAAYVIHRDFDLFEDERQTHFGIRAYGEWLPGGESWLEVSRMRGKLGRWETGGWGVDAGHTLLFDNGLNLTAGYAWGQGDDRSTPRDENFRQTGLQDNNDKFGGVTSFRYYGELTDPELVNLEIMTLGIGYRFPRRISLDLVGHYYRQDEPSRRWINSDIDKRPNGVDKELGWEMDFILGWRTHPSWDLEIVGAWFRPGKAFNDADDAFLGKLQLRYRF